MQKARQRHYDDITHVRLYSNNVETERRAKEATIVTGIEDEIDRAEIKHKKRN